MVSNELLEKFKKEQTQLDIEDLEDLKNLELRTLTLQEANNVIYSLLNTFNEYQFQCFDILLKFLHDEFIYEKSIINSGAISKDYEFIREFLILSYTHSKDFKEKEVKELEDIQIGGYDEE